MHSEFVDRSRPKTIRIHSGWSSRTQQINPFCRTKTESDRFPARKCVCVCIYIYRLQLHYTCTTKPGSKNIIYWCWLSEKVTLLISPSKKVIIIHYKSKANQDWYYKNHGYSDQKNVRLLSLIILIIIPIGSMYGIYANIWGILMVKYGKC